MTYLLAWFVLSIPLGFLLGQMMGLNTWEYDIAAFRLCMAGPDVTVTWTWRTSLLSRKGSVNDEGENEWNLI